MIAVVSFTVSLYLEFRQLNFLQAHPIMVNLISGVVGFTSGFLVLSIGVNWFFERQWALDRVRRADGTTLDALKKMENLHRIAVRTSPVDDAVSVLREMKHVAQFFELGEDPNIARVIALTYNRVNSGDVHEGFVAGAAHNLLRYMERHARYRSLKRLRDSVEMQQMVREIFSSRVACNPEILTIPRSDADIPAAGKSAPRDHSIGG